MLIRYGERVMCNVEDEAGNQVPLTVTEFIQTTFEQDGLRFRHPLNRRIMDESVQHVHDEGFVAVRFFQNHPDEEVANLANELAFDKEPLSKIYDKDQTIIPDDQRLDELVPRIMMDYKLALVSEELETLLSELRNPEVMKQQERALDLMRRLQELKQIQTQLAKACGDRVIT